MTTNDSRSTDGRSTFADDEVEVAPEEQTYTPPPTSTRSEQPVPIEVLDPPDDPAPDDPTPPDVAPQQAATDAPVDNRPDVPRTPDGEPTDFQPLRVPVMHEYDAESESSATSDLPPATATATAEPADDDRWQAIQVRFVDDPSGAVAEAAELVEDAVAALRDDDSSDPTGDSTEQLRRAFRHYRAIHEIVTTPPSS